MMKSIKLKKIGAGFVLMAMVFLGACSKTEFLPDPEGAQVPYQNDATKTVDELLAASPAKLFYSAWIKSTVKATLKEQSSKVIFTVFAPDDVAMHAAGLTAAAISQMSETAADELVLFYTSIGPVKIEDIKQRPDNFMVKSLLKSPGLYVKYYENVTNPSRAYDFYYYRYYVGVNGDNLLINGKNTGKVNYTPATNGGLYLIGQTVEKPTKTIKEVLEADGRFTMFLESQRLTDEMFIEQGLALVEMYNGYLPEVDELKRDYAYTHIFYDTDWGINPFLYGDIAPNITISTLFAPTDDAFHKAGLNTLEDVRKLNERGEGVTFDETMWTLAGGLAMDTILSYHRDWGRINAPSDPSFGSKASPNEAVFHSNALTSAISEFMVSAGGTPSIQYAYKMPLEFSKNNTSVQLKVRGSEHPAATLTEGDINTLNGPIHVVDRLLIPKGFKLN